MVIIGNLTADPRTGTTQSGKQYCSFTVAVNRRQSAQAGPDADFFRVSTFGNLADICGKYLAKGRKVAVTGSVSVSTYTTQKGETRASMDVFANDVEFLTTLDKDQQKAPEAPKMDKKSGFVQVEEPLPF